MSYLRTLLLALRGRDPFREQVESLDKDLKTASDKQNSLEEKLETLDKLLGRERERINGYINLTENLRQRIAEKDAQIEDTSSYYRGLLKDKEEAMSELRSRMLAAENELDTVRKDIGKEMRNSNLLTKTNSGLSDLCTAMSCGDIEKMMMVTEYLEWNSYLTRIAQYHLTVLRRKDELEERLNG